MNQQHCYHFKFLPMGMRVLYTATLLVLGTGYLFAMIYIFESHAGRDGKPGLSVDDLVIAYSGSKAATRLENALNGPMANMLPPEQRGEIILWTRSGAKKEDFDAKIAPIIEQRCMTCHNGSNPHLPNLKGYDNVMQVVQIDHGMSISTLVRVSHIHLFGITFIFFIVGSIFCHAYIKPLWVKCVVIALPFLSVFFDIMSWYLTKISTPFAWVIMISGGFMGLSFAIQWFVSMWQMWLYKVPEDLQNNNGVVS